MTTRHRWFGTLGLRLLAAFLAVAVGAIALVAFVAAVSVDRRTSELAQSERDQLRSQVATALAAAYSSGRRSWQPNELSGVQVLADAHGAHVTVRDSTGRQVTTVEPRHHDGSGAPTSPPSSPAEPHHEDAPTATVPGTPHDDEPSPGPTHDSDDSGHALAPRSDAAVALTSARSVPSEPASATAPVTPSRPASGPGPDSMTVPIVVDGRRVGTAEITVPSGSDAAITAARDALLRAVALGAALAVLLAAIAAAFVTRRMSLPLVALAGATRSFAAGDTNPERLLRPAPGELGDVGRSFATMAATVRRQDELRRAVVADVAHELRTPVTILRGQTEQLLDGVAAPSTARLLSLHDEVLRLERLTDDLATLAAADAAGLALHSARVDLAELTRRAVDAMRPALADARLDLALEAHGPVIVDGDVDRLTQVVTNLLTNAVKFTPAGGAVTVAVLQSGDEAVLTVTDSGPGIPTEELPHLFERFWRGRAAGSRGGTGIGLAVVQALVTAHGGTITAGNAPAGGARFVVRQPIAPVAATEEALRP